MLGRKDEQEYIDFMIKLSEKTRDLMSDYRNLSLENQQKVSEVCGRIILTQGINGVIRFVENPLSK